LSDDPFDHPWRTLQVTRADAVVEVRLHRPDARNALDPTLMEELTDVARRLRLRPDVAAVILTGAPEGFSAGADLRSADRAATPTLLERRRDVMRGPDLCRAWEEIEAVTLVAIEGYAIGGACALAVACDFRIMGQGAYFRCPRSRSA
jgi:enoyl-CoA hydratase/carnithine racemase